MNDLNERSVSFLDGMAVIRRPSLPHELLGNTLLKRFEAWRTLNPGCKLYAGGSADVSCFDTRTKARFSPDGSIYDLTGSVKKRPPTIVAETSFSETLSHVREKAANYLLSFGVQLVVILNFEFKKSISDVRTREDVTDIMIEMWRLSNVKKEKHGPKELLKVFENHKDHDEHGPLSYYKWFMEGNLMRLKAGRDDCYKVGILDET